MDELRRRPSTAEPRHSPVRRGVGRHPSVVYNAFRRRHGFLPLIGRSVARPGDNRGASPAVRRRTRRDLRTACPAFGRYDADRRFDRAVGPFDPLPSEAIARPLGTTQDRICTARGNSGFTCGAECRSRDTRGIRSRPGSARSPAAGRDRKTQQQRKRRGGTRSATKSRTKWEGHGQPS